MLMLIPPLVGGCVVEPAAETSIPSAAPDRPSHRLAATASAPQSLEQGRLNQQRLQAQRDRIDAIGRRALGAMDKESDWQPVLRRILFHPDDHQLLEYGEQFRQLPIIATPIRLEIRNGQVIRIEGAPHRLPADFDTTATIDRPSAEELARIYVSALPNAEASGLLVILAASGGEDGPPRLAWQIDLPGIRVWIDAREGRMLRHQRR
jgi:hypothetical protein